MVEGNRQNAATACELAAQTLGVCGSDRRLQTVCQAKRALGGNAAVAPSRAIDLRVCITTELQKSLYLGRGSPRTRETAPARSLFGTADVTLRVSAPPPTHLREDDQRQLVPAAAAQLRPGGDGMGGAVWWLSRCAGQESQRSNTQICRYACRRARLKHNTAPCL